MRMSHNTDNEQICEKDKQFKNLRHLCDKLASVIGKFKNAPVSKTLQHYNAKNNYNTRAKVIELQQNHSIVQHRCPVCNYKIKVDTVRCPYCKELLKGDIPEEFTHESKGVKEIKGINNAFYNWICTLLIIGLVKNLVYYVFGFIAIAPSGENLIIFSCCTELIFGLKVIWAVLKKKSDGLLLLFYMLLFNIIVSTLFIVLSMLNEDLDLLFGSIATIVISSYFLANIKDKNLLRVFPKHARLTLFDKVILILYILSILTIFVSEIMPFINN